MNGVPQGSVLGPPQLLVTVYPRQRQITDAAATSSTTNEIQAKQKESE